MTFYNFFLKKNFLNGSTHGQNKTIMHVGMQNKSTTTNKRVSGERRKPWYRNKIRHKMSLFLQ